MKVSVIIPVWNIAPFLERCVQSVCHQTYQDLEIILIDDGSTDGSNTLCDTLAQGDPRIRVVHQPHLGASAARNAGLDIASGQYVQFIDGDDILEPNAVTRLLQTILKDKSDLVICGHRRLSYNTNNEIVSDIPQLAGTSGCFDRKKFLDRFSQCGYLVYIGWEYCWDRLLSRDFLEQYHIRFAVGMTLCEDRMFNLNCIAACTTVSIIPDYLCHHFMPVCNRNFFSASTRADETRWQAHQESFEKLYDVLVTNECLSTDVQEAVHQDYFNTMVVAIYRICRSDNRAPLWNKLSLISKICSHPMMREAVRTYTPKSAKESRVMPYLIRFGNALSVTLFATWKARRIYG
jgi:glycosyltransferase involved in cell wall biosynthesis